MRDVLLWEVLVGLGSGALLGALGVRGRVLTRSGGIALLAVCTAVFAAGGWEWGVVLVLYLVTTALWARFRRGVKQSLARHHEVRTRQGAFQVIARTGWAALLAIVRLAAAHSTVAYVAFVGAIAAALADRWGTEVGMLSGEPPRMITTRLRVEAGMPGAISSLGLVAALGGTWLIGLVGLGTQALSAWLAMRSYDRGLLWLPLAAMIGGLVASLVDSLLGATAQSMYYCEGCQRTTEDPAHTCESPAGSVRRTRGIPWLSDEMVDLVSALVGAALTALLVSMFAGLAAR